MSSTDISVQLYSVREALAQDFEQTLRTIADLGYGNVELYDFVDRADQYAELLPELGLRVPSAHTHLLGKELSPIFDAAVRIGVPTVIEPMIPESRWTDRDGIIAAAKDLSAVAEVAADRGLTVGYHNHWWELEHRIDGTPALEVFAEHLAPSVVLEVDTYWVYVAGVPPVELLGRLGDRVQFLHVKDGPGTYSDVDQVVVGTGVMPVREILAAAPQALRVVEFDDYAGDIIEALAASLAYVAAL
jgi:sugar phosphate isomerase/epimerase